LSLLSPSISVPLSYLSPYFSVSLSTLIPVPLPLLLSSIYALCVVSFFCVCPSLFFRPSVCNVLIFAAICNLSSPPSVPLSMMFLPVSFPLSVISLICPLFSL
jgi:hypothetical protein